MVRVMGWATALGIGFWSAGAVAQTPPAASFPEEAAPSAAPPAGAPSATAAPPTTAPAAAASTDEAAAQPSATAPAARSVAPPAAPATAPYEPPEPEPEHAKRDDGKIVSITFSPLHLFLPLFEAQVEVELLPHFGAALIGGIGSISADSPDADIDGESFSAYELGGQLVGYPLADFKSLQLGAELLYVHVSTEDFNGQQIRANAGGVAIGPFVGYKVLTSVGFTFFVQGGFEYMAVKADASDDTGAAASAEQSSIIPLLNLNVGWSF